MDEQNTEARSAPEGASPEGSKSESSSPEIPDASREGQSPAREVYMLEVRGILDPRYWDYNEKDAQEYIQSRAWLIQERPRIVRLVEAAPASPSLEAPKASEVDIPKIAGLGDGNTKCTVCGIGIFGAKIGDGDGDGNRFAHPECWYKKQYLALKAEVRALRKLAPPPSPVQGGADALGHTPRVLKLGNKGWIACADCGLILPAKRPCRGVVKVTTRAPAPAVQGAPTEAERYPTLLLVEILENGAAINSRNAPEWAWRTVRSLVEINLPKAGEGGEKKPTPEAGPSRGLRECVEEFLALGKARIPGGVNWKTLPIKVSRGWWNKWAAKAEDALSAPEPEAGGAQDGEGDDMDGEDIATLIDVVKDCFADLRPLAIRAQKELARLRSLPLSEGRGDNAPAAARLSAKELAAKHRIKTRSDSREVDYLTGKRIDEEPAQPAPGGQGADTPLDVEGAARKLLARIDEIHQDPKYQAVWTLAYLHQGQYRGPQYFEELEALRLALRTPTHKAPPTERSEVPEAGLPAGGSKSNPSPGVSEGPKEGGLA